MYRAPMLALNTDVKTTNPDVAGRTMYSIRSYKDGQPDVVIPEPSSPEYNPRAAGLAPEVNALALRFDRVASEADRLIKISEAEILKRGGVIPAVRLLLINHGLTNTLLSSSSSLSSPSSLLLPLLF